MIDKLLSSQIKRKNIIYISLATLALGLITGLLSSPQKNASSPTASSSGIAVRTVEVEQKDILRSFVTQGKLQAIRSVKVRAPQGSYVKELKVQLGEPVKKGQPIVELDSELRDLREALGKIEEESREIEYRVTAALARGDFISKKDFQQKNLEKKSMQIRKRIQQLESPKTLDAPIDGVISTMNMNQGDFVDDSSKYFYQVVDNSQYRIELFVPPSIVEKIEIEDDVSLYQKQRVQKRGLASVKNTNANAYINAIAPTLDPKTGSVKIEIFTEGRPKNWLAGSFVDVKIPLERASQALAIPTSVILYEKSKPFVFVVSDTEDKVLVKKTWIETGLTDGAYTEVLKGVEDLDEIVSEGQGNLSHLSEVQIVRNPSSEASTW